MTELNMCSRTRRFLQIILPFLIIEMCSFLISQKSSVAAVAENKEAGTVIEIKAPFDGTISSIGVKEDELIAKGQVLAIVKSPILELQYSNCIKKIQDLRREVDSIVGRDGPPPKLQRLIDEIARYEEFKDQLQIKIDAGTIRASADGTVLGILDVRAQTPVEQGQSLMIVKFKHAPTTKVNAPEPTSTTQPASTSQ